MKGKRNALRDFQRYELRIFPRDGRLLLRNLTDYESGRGAPSAGMRLHNHRGEREALLRADLFRVLVSLLERLVLGKNLFWSLDCSVEEIRFHS